MPSYGSVAAKVRQHKEDHPERYCPVPRCLWRLEPGQKCGKHGKTAPQPEAKPETQEGDARDAA